MRYYSPKLEKEFFLTGVVEIENRKIENADRLTQQEIDSIGLIPIEVIKPVLNELYQFISGTNYFVQSDKVIKIYQIENNTSTYPDLVQARLDSFAKEKDFDGINDACSYVLSTNLLWRAEAERAVELRDLTWLAFYNSTSTDWLEIEAQLPQLTWT